MDIHRIKLLSNNPTDFSQISTAPLPSPLPSEGREGERKRESKIKTETYDVIVTKVPLAGYWFGVTWPVWKGGGGYLAYVWGGRVRGLPGRSDHLRYLSPALSSSPSAPPPPPSRLPPPLLLLLICPHPLVFLLLLLRFPHLALPLPRLLPSPLPTSPLGLLTILRDLPLSLSAWGMRSTILDRAD